MSGNIKIPKNNDIVAIWGIQDGSGYPLEGYSNYFPTHDHSFCVMSSDGNIKTSLELERITRVKNDYRLSKYIEDFSKYLPEDFLLVSVNHFAGSSFISENGLWRVEGKVFNISDLITPTKSFVNRKWRESYICSHELAHIGSILPFVGKFKDNSLLIHIDGLASESCFSVFKYKEGKIEHIHHGWEPLEEIQIFGFNDLTCSMMGMDEKHRLATAGRLMGYSSYGKYNDRIRKWLKENNWYSNHWENPHKFFADVKKEFGKSFETFDLNNQFFKDIAFVCQKEFEETIFELIKKYKDLTGTDYLYLSGGSALNINLNTKIIQSGLFKEVFVPPCCSDTGLALGAASIVQMLRGNEISTCSPFLNSVEVEDKKLKKLSKTMVEQIVDRLYKGEIMGVCIGLSEIGPRALGHRSIMAIPISRKMYDKVNTNIKRREWYRPLAPIIIDSLAEEVFPGSTETMLSKYMLSNFKVSNQWVDKIPAVIHIDGTSRTQVVYKEEKELEPIYKILEMLWDKYKIPCLINTSFNGPGEPIVNSDNDAIATATKLGMDFVLLDDKIVNILPNEI